MKKKTPKTKKPALKKSKKPAEISIILDMMTLVGLMQGGSHLQLGDDKDIPSVRIILNEEFYDSDEACQDIEELWDFA